MRSIPLIRFLLLGITAAGLSGCATYPVAISLREQARPVTLVQATAQPDVYTGTVVIWGGRVIKTVNDTNGSSIYVLRLPLSHYEIPIVPSVSSGRFIARSNGFIDPQVMKNGQLITVAGVLEGVVKEPLQKIEYTYPVVDIRQIHQWYVPRRYYYYMPSYWDWYGPGVTWGWGPGWGWYGPGWGWGWYGPDWDWDWH